MDLTNLIQKCRQGDKDSLGELYRLYRKNAMGTAYLISGHKCIAEDIVQEAFMQCFRDIKYLRKPETFDIWFYKILLRTGWRLAKKNNHITPVDNIAEHLQDSENDSLDGTRFEDANYAVHEAIDKLSAPLKTVVILHYFDDLAIVDIAKILGCFQGTVKSRLFNARKQLQQLLSESDNIIGFKTASNGKECRSNGY